jgi:hypothetical protein
MTEHEHNISVDKDILTDIENIGWTVILIEATDYLPSFAYTIGLWKNYGHSELISFGLTIKTLHQIINDAGEIIKSGQKIITGKTYDNFFKNGKAEFIKVDSRNIANYFGFGIDYYKTKDIPAMQLIWTDRNDKFPWELDFEEEFIYKQPLLDRNADFKFREAKNLAIFTTSHWLEQNKPILTVIHDHDGDWQFLTGDPIEGNAKLVALEQMTIRDKTLNEIFDLDYGEEAERESIGGRWTRNKLEEYNDE